MKTNLNHSETFKESLSEVVEDKIKELKEDINKQTEYLVVADRASKMPVTMFQMMFGYKVRKWFADIWFSEWFQKEQEIRFNRLLSQFKRFAFLKKRLEDDISWRENGNAITDEMIASAKQYPITQLLDIKRGKTRCLWHDDQHPSMQYYQKENTLYCFSCNKFADAIDVFMKMYECDFRQAVKELSNI